jgi:hypothetical protein
VGEIILVKIIPCAVLWFTGEARLYEDDDEEDEEHDFQDLEDDEGEDDDDDEGRDPNWAPPAGAQGGAPPDCKQS